MSGTSQQEAIKRYNNKNLLKALITFTKKGFKRAANFTHIIHKHTAAATTTTTAAIAASADKIRNGHLQASTTLLAFIDEPVKPQEPFR